MLVAIAESVSGETGAAASKPVVYDSAFPAIAYSTAPRGNPVVELMGKLATGELQLEYKAPRGYLDALLAALDIDASSQVLVFSPTSLQAAYITSRTPRAIYFNDHTYVAWVQGSEHLELLTVDAERGPVFFSVLNAPGHPPAFERATLRCMACHDSAALQPGGIPRVMVLSSLVEDHLNPAGRQVPVEVTHATALEDRWGGWFVTGRLGNQLHLGNLPLKGPADPVVRAIHNRSNLDGLRAHFDTSPYITDKSDIAALLVLEHQAYVQNLITRLKYESSRVADPASPQVAPHVEKLVTALTFQDERRLLGRIRGSAGFEAQFERRGPADGEGRSLRQFDLTQSTFRHGVSYLVHSAQFQALPLPVRQVVYVGIRDYLQNSARDAVRGRQTLEVLAATVPDFPGAP
jgi:hypothetical protein